MKTGKKILVVVLAVLALGVVAGGTSYATAVKINGANKTNDTIKGWFDKTDNGATVKVGDTKALKMVDVSKDKGASDSWIAQFKIDKLTLTKNQEVIFTYKGERIYPGASGSGNNLSYDVTTKSLKVISSGTDVTMYLKVHNDGYDVWCTGYNTIPATGAGIKIGNSDFRSMEDQSSSKGESDTWLKQYYYFGSISSGSEIQFTYNGERIYPTASGEGNAVSYNSENKSLTMSSGSETMGIYLKVYADGYDVWAAATYGGLYSI